MSPDARDYDVFMKLKKQLYENINKDNAAQILQTASIKILKYLEKLDINNITEIEDLYLIVAQLTQAAALVVAQDKSDLQNISFDEALNSIGTDDLLPFLEKTFENKHGKENLFKFIAIDEKYKPGKEAWAALHDKMDKIARKAKITHTEKILKETVSDYKDHLEKKLKKNGVDIANREISDDTPPAIKKLITRYEAIAGLNEKIQSKHNLSTADITEAKQSITTCLKNKPDWSERSFLQKLTDVLSLGLKPLYRAFFSKESHFQETIENTFNPPKIGG